MPAASRAKPRRAVRRANRKPPLDRRGAVGDQAHRRADARARRRAGLRRGHELRHGRQRRARPSSGSSRRASPESPARRRAASPPATRTAIRNGRPPGDLIAFTAKRKDDEEPQIYLIAPDGGEARAPHARSRPAARRSSGSPTASGSRSCRGCGRISRPTPEQAKRKKERKDAKVKAHVTERAEFRFWDHWLTDGREPHVYVCDVATGRCRDALAGTGLALPPWEPRAEDFDIAPDGRELALAVDLGPEPRMMNQRDIVTIDLATRRKRVLTAGTGTDDAAPVYSPDGRALAFHAYDTKRSFNDQGRLMRARAPHGTHARARAAARPASPARRVGARLALACCASIEDRGRVGLWRLPADATDARGRPDPDRRRRRDRRLRAIARRLGARLRPRDA